MKLYELNTPLEKHRVIMYSADGKKALCHHVQMCHLAGNVYIGEIEPDGRYTAYTLFQAYKIGVVVTDYDPDTEDSAVLKAVMLCALDSVESFVACMERSVAACEWITLPQVELLKHVKPELVPLAQDARKTYRQRLDERRRAREQRQREEDEAYVKAENDRAHAMLESAVERMRSGGDIANAKIELYSGRYQSKRGCVLGFLMDAYGISMPIRTRGWLNNNLSQITVDQNGHCTHCRYLRSGRSKGSQAIWDYLERLIQAARAGDAKVMEG